MNTMACCRRLFIMGSLAAAVASSAWSQSAAEVKVGLLVPLTGPFARQGSMMVKGAELAVEHINANGGVRAMGGAKVKLVVSDAGESIEKAKNAAQRMVADHPDMVGASGAWSSSFTLAATEVTERAGLPFITSSFGDQITERGFKHIFQASATASTQSRSALPAVLEVAKQATGKAPSSIGIIMDNTASPTGFVKGMRDNGGLEKLGLTLKMDEVFTPPLADASSVVQKLRSAKPQLLMLLPSSISDDKLILERMNEVGLGKGRIPIVASGAHMGAPELLKVVGKDLLENVFVVVANWGGKGQEKIVADFTKKTGEPWMSQDAISAYADLWFFKSAVEQAGSTDRAKVTAAMKGLKDDGAVARLYGGNALRFDEAGHRVDAGVMILQWQDGRPRVVFPANLADAKARWPGAQ